MTTTRKYFEELLKYLGEVCLWKQSDVLDILNSKANLYNLISRIEKFNLFELTFSSEFKKVLTSNRIEDFRYEKLFLISELHYELIECIWFTRLRYSGEFLQYLSKIKAFLLDLSLDELGEFNVVKKDSKQILIGEPLIFHDEKSKSLKKRELIKLSKAEVNGEKIRLTKANYQKIEKQLKECFAVYKEYVYNNFSFLLDIFPYYNACIIGYITQAMSKDIFEFRIHAYKSISSNGSVKLEYKYYDFYPSYFYNLEEIPEEQIGALVTSLKRDDFTFINPFSKINIHYQLIEYYLINSNELEIKEFVGFLLKLDGYKILNHVCCNKDDLRGSKDKSEFLFEIYHHQNRSINTVINRINNLSLLLHRQKVIFVFTSEPGIALRNIIQNSEFGIYVLSDRISHFFNLDISDVLSWYIKDRLLKFESLDKPSSILLDGNTLIKQLKDCPYGDLYWGEYESIGAKVFKFLFEDDFRKYIAEEQVSNDIKNHRKDLIVSNSYKDPSSFWAKAKVDYKANAVIIDFKNYSSPLNSSTFFSVSKYTKRNVGYFAIIFCRLGLELSAEKEQKSLFVDGKLVIAFSDEEIVEMIREKMVGKQPTDRLETKLFEIIKSV